MDELMASLRQHGVIYGALVISGDLLTRHGTALLEAFPVLERFGFVRQGGAAIHEFSPTERLEVALI